MIGNVISVAVCDDDAFTRAELLKWLPSTPLPQGYRITPVEVPCGDELIRRHRNGERFDIIFLDMMMPGADGMATASALRASGDGSIIICLTSSPDFAVQSYRIDAFDYIIKSNGIPQLEAALAKAVAVLTAQNARRLIIRSGTTLCAVLYANIEYIEVFSKKLFYHLASGEVIESYRPIRELEAELSGQPEFFKIHRSIIVNLSYLTEIDPHFVRTVSSERLPVARGKYDQLETAFLVCSAKI